MDSYLRELGEHKAGTRDFDPQLPLTVLDRAADMSEAELDTGPSAERCASLYDAIREMSSYGSEREAEKRKSSGAGILRNQ